MQAVLLAAGQGLSLRPLTADRPKCLLPVAGRPLVDHWIEALARAGVHEIILVVGHGDERLRAHLGDGARFGVQLTYVRQERQLGPAQALATAGPHLKDARFLVLHADAWLDDSVIQALVSGSGLALAYSAEPGEARHGRLGVKAGALDAASADQPLRAIGAYVLDATVLSRLGLDRGAVVLALSSCGPVKAIPVASEQHTDLITADDLLRIHRALMPRITDRNEGTIETGAAVVGPVSIAAGSVVRTGAILRGPVVVGKNCDIGPGAVLLPGTALSNHVRIGALSVLGDCSVGSNASIGEQAGVRAAILDNGVTLEAGARVHGPPMSVVGADARLGTGALALPGCIIGRGATVAPGRSVGRVPDGGMAV